MKRFFLFFTFFANLSAYQYELSIGVIFQNEAPYLKEWIEYHKLLGVSHFYCYNNLSTDNYLEVLKPYLENGIAELCDIPTLANDFKTYYDMQCKCYTACVKKAEGESKWVAFIDPDEFLLPSRDISLTSFLKDYESFGGVVANWKMFGTSKVKKIPKDKLLIETLTMASEKSYACNRFVKSIVQPEKVSHFDSAHQATYKEGFNSVNTDKFPSDQDKSYCILWNKLVINHYWTRDEDFFYNVKVARQKTWGGKPNPEELFRLMNVEQDQKILRYVPALRKILNL